VACFCFCSYVDSFPLGGFVACDVSSSQCQLLCDLTTNSGTVLSFGQAVSACIYGNGSDPGKSACLSSLMKCSDYVPLDSVGINADSIANIFVLGVHGGLLASFPLGFGLLSLLSVVFLMSYAARSY
jgi:hypothetical protein